MNNNPKFDSRMQREFRIDFTLSTYKLLLNAFISHGYVFQTFEKFLKDPAPKVVMLRHDVDKLPQNALKMAQLENKNGLRASYYFRVVPEAWDKAVMELIAELGHEIGYHYEDMTIAKGDRLKAFRHFDIQLRRFRQIYPVKTICMHGSPLSPYANRDLWLDHDYKEFGIIGEPYFDVNFKEVFYITDTGRKWNNTPTSVRDRVQSGFDIPIKNSFHLISLAQQGELPRQIMITVHPQRWHDRWWPWIKEIVGQNVKNIFKYFLIRMRGDR